MKKQLIAVSLIVPHIVMDAGCPLTSGEYNYNGSGFLAQLTDYGSSYYAEAQYLSTTYKWLKGSNDGTLCSGGAYQDDYSDWTFTNGMYKVQWWYDSTYAVGYTYVKDTGSGIAWGRGL